MSVVLFKTLQVILALSVLIILHEFGHFTFAKLFGIKVEKFYLFFDVGGFKLFHFRIGDTEYGMGWLPLGGYCKIAGMIDESLDLEQMKSEPKPWEFRTHPSWQRLLVMAGGVLYNFIFAAIFSSIILCIWGSASIDNSSSQIYPNELAVEMGFKPGDRVLSFDDYVPQDFSMLQADLARRKVREAHVLRGSDTVTIYIDQAMMGQVLDSPLMFNLAVPFVVDSACAPNTGLLRGDKVVAVAGEQVEFLQDASPVLASHAGESVLAQVERGGSLVDVPVLVDTAGRLGVYLARPAIVARQYGVLQSIPAGFSRTWTLARDYLRDLRMVATPSTGAYKSVGSFISIGSIFPTQWNWYQFLNILALLSVMLGVVNLIPIPGLDGGHILFTLVEMVTGRKPGEKFLVAAQMVGLALLLGLMFLAFGNDISRFIIK